MKKLEILDESERIKLIEHYEKSFYTTIKQGFSNKEFFDKIADYSKSNGINIEHISTTSTKPLGLLKETSYFTLNNSKYTLYHLQQIKSYGISGPEHSSTHERSLLTNQYGFLVSDCSLDEEVDEYSGGGMLNCSRGAKTTLNLMDPFAKFIYPLIQI
ncbi:MAG: hypothetical protein WC867_02885 [Candidatus Pacearchaeota archaeon]|jgi:hypothetical protein